MKKFFSKKPVKALGTDNKPALSIESFRANK